MLNFAVGPVMMDPSILRIGYNQLPYFRTDQFSELMKDNEKMLLELISAPDNSKCVFMTASGTGSMEACVNQLLSEKDKALVVNGGTFGQRFVDLCERYNRTYTEIKLNFGSRLNHDNLWMYANKGYTALLINMHETSSGTLYDMEMVADFCRRHGLFLIVDAISSFLADELDMERICADAVIISSQKALALPPGLSMIVLSESAIGRIDDCFYTGLYLNLKEALKDGKRGQTPFTPAVQIILQLNFRLKKILNNGGIQTELDKVRKTAEQFRQNMDGLPLRILSENPSNALTALYTSGKNAELIVKTLREDYHIWVCPNGGKYSNEIFRVGHIGYITESDNRTLISALYNMSDKGIL